MPTVVEVEDELNVVGTVASVGVPPISASVVGETAGEIAGGVPLEVEMPVAAMGVMLMVKDAFQAG